jgi:hypothetical protein
MIEEKKMIGGNRPGAGKALFIAVAVALGVLAAPARAQTTVTTYGYVKLDAIFNSVKSNALVGDHALIPGTIRLDSAKANEEDNFLMHARQSRLGFRTSTPTNMGPLTTLLEFDLFGTDGNESSSNSHNVRLRHAYASLGALSAGQFWTNFMFLPSFAETVDFGGHVGQIFVRQAQIRYTGKLDKGEWAVSIENPESVVATPTAAAFRANDDRVPDVVGRVSFGVGKGQLSVVGMARNIRVDSAAAPAADDDKWGGAVGVTGVFPTWGKDDFKFGVHAGDVLGRYAGVSFWADGIVNAAGKIELPDQWIARAAYRHWWSGTVRSSLVLSAGESDNPVGTIGTLNREMASAHLNLIWSPVPRVNLGAEVIRAVREVESGEKGHLTRVQVSGQYSF